MKRMASRQLRDRAFQPVSLVPFASGNGPEEVGLVEITCPHEDQYILRMLVRETHAGWAIPPELEWLRPTLMAAEKHQEEVVGVIHPYVYVTVRHGLVRSQEDDAWHVDGFSTRVTHLPEANYVVANANGTEYVEHPFEIPSDFHPRKHNLHDFLGRRVRESEIKKLKPNVMYGMDPYVVHRRPKATEGEIRTFVRISFIPIEIPDKANTQNPLLPARAVNDGIVFRKALELYDET